MVVTFSGESSMVNITSPLSPEVNISSLVIHFKTSQLNSQIVSMMSGRWSFAVIIKNNGSLAIDYNFEETNGESVDIGKEIYNQNNQIKFFVLIK